MDSASGILTSSVVWGKLLNPLLLNILMYTRNDNTYYTGDGRRINKTGEFSPATSMIRTP